jgi:hypothetical protein
VVEDNPAWLPDEAGCGPLKSLLIGPHAVREQILIFSLWPFRALGAESEHGSDWDKQV